MHRATWMQVSRMICGRRVVHNAKAKTGVVGRLVAAAAAVAVVVGLLPAISAISSAGVGAATSGVTSGTLRHTVLTDAALTWAQQFSPPSLVGATCFDTEDCQVVGSVNGEPAIYATANQGWTWTTPATFSGTGTMADVSCVSDSTCWAVGTLGGDRVVYKSSAANTSSPAWTAETLPGTASGTMNSISCVVVSSSDDCWAAGLNSGGTSLIVDGTTDGGTSWTAETESPTGTLTNPAISCQATATKGTCVVVTGKNAWVTVNSGTAWSASSLTGISSPVLDGVSCPSTSVCFATANGTGVVKLSGGTTYKASGEAWSTLSIGVTVESLSGISCASASVCTTGGLQDATYTTGSVNLGYQGAVLTTTNGGTSWTSSLTNGAPPTNLLANALLVDGPSFFSCPTSSACLAGGVEGVVSTQDDNAAPWTGAFLTPNIATATLLNCVSLLACYLSPGSDVAYRSSGGGLGWTPENLPTTEKNGSSFSGPTNSVSNSSCNGTSLCAFLGKTTDGAYDEGWSSDGQTWAAQAENATSGTTFTALSCFTVTTGYCIYFEKPPSSAAALEVTGPCTLTSCPSLGSLSNIENADGSSCVGSEDCWVVGQTTSGDGAVWATTNAGVNWTQQSLPTALSGTIRFSYAPSSPISCSDAEDCVVANDDGDFASTSTGGTSWSTFSAGSTVNSESSLSCPDADDCVAIVGTTVPSTELVALTYAGTSWSATPSALPSSYTSASSVTCADASDCWVLAGNGTVNQAVLSTNGQDGPLDGPLTQGEEFAGNMAESKGQSPQAWAGDVNTADGDYSDSIPLISIPARGLPFGLSLTYDAQLAQYQVASGATSPGPYGWGWTASNDLSITAGPGTNQVTVNQEGGAQVVYNEMSGPTYAPVESNRVLASLSYSGGDYTLEPNGGLQQYEFSASGPTAAGTLVAEKDANGNTTTFGTETKGTGNCPNTTGVANCSTITDPAGRVITVVNATTTGLVSQVIDPATNTWLLGYDTHGNLVTVKDPKTNTTTFGYDTANTNANLVHDMTEITPARNVGSTLIAYDSLGRVYCQVAPVEEAASVTCPSVGSAWTTTKPVTLYQYSGSNSSYMGGTTTITDPHDNVTNHYYADGTLVATTSGVGTATPATVSIERDPATLLGAKVTDPDGNTTTTTYDSRGNALTVTDPLGNVTTTSYNTTFNEPLVVTDPKGITTTYTYDADGNQLTKTVSALGTETGPPGWIKATADSGIKIQGISCPLITLCVGVDHSGHVEWSTNPMGATPAWSTDGVSVSAYALNGISCPTAGLCVAVGASGQIVVSGSPTGGHTLWSAATADGTTAINAVSCPLTSLCVATDAAGYVLTATSPSGGASAWTKTHIDGTTSITAVSCATTTLCVATDANGNVLTTTNPTGGAGAWTTTDIDGSANLTSATCPSTSLCAVTDVNGDVLTATSPTGGSGSWTKTDIDGSTALDAVSCASVTLCVATDGSGNVLAAASPTGTATAWTKTDVDGSTALPAAGCPTAALCVVGDGSGSVLASTDPTGLPPWSKTTPDIAAILGLSCPSASLCVGVDHSGDVLWSTTPSSGGWSTPLNVDSNALNGISCPSTGLCVAVGAAGQILKSTNPIGGAWSSTTADGTTAVNAVSCPSTSLCVASDANGDILYNTSPVTSATWTKTDIDGTADITDVSCASATQCVATSATGYVITTTNPTGAASAWTITSIDTPNDVTSVDCPSTSLCVATDANGDVIAATTPTGGSGSWTKADIDGSTTIDAVNCASPSLCAVADGAGTVFTATNPAGGVWGQDDIDGSATLEAVGCPTTNECITTDGSGAVLATTKARGFLSSTTSYTYGGAYPGDVMAVTDPDGHVTSLTYDADGDVATTTVTAGSQVDTTTNKYDSLGQKYCEIGPDANAASVICAAQGSYYADTTTWAYDADGNVTGVTDPDGHTTSYSYDADNNKTLTTDALSNETETTYDADDRKATVISGYGSTSATTTTYTYDILSASCPTPVPAGTTYCTQVENGLGAGYTTTNYFNALDQMIETAAPSTTAQTPTTYTYDPAGNTLTTTDGSGTTTDTYDADSRVIGITYSNTATGYVQPHAVTYQYDADGDRTQMTDGTGTTTYTYDPLNRLQGVTNGASNTVTYAYDPAGNAICLSYPNSLSTTCQTALSGTGLVTYGYDAANRTVTMADWVDPATPTVFSYDNDSNLTGTTFPTTTPDTVTNGYDDTDALTSVSGVSALTRNADESIGTTTPAGGSLDTYGYDPLNRVTAGTTPSDPSGTTTAYTYDAASEISSATPSGGSTTDYEYNTDGQLCWTATTTGSCTSPPSGSNTYTYSTAGERTLKTFSTGGSTIYQWDQAGDLTCITPSGTSCASPNLSETNTFTYNGDGLRMSDYLPASETTQQFTWDVSRSVPRLLECGGEYFFYGPNVGSAPIEQINISSGARNFLVSDPTGVREGINSSGTAFGTMSYDSYGNPCASCTPFSVFGFEGGYTDQTGLIYLINRYYDPSTNQFLSVDPDVAETGQPYAFVEDDPVNATDPTGDLFCQSGGTCGTRQYFASQPPPSSLGAPAEAHCQASTSSPPSSELLGTCPTSIAPPQAPRVIPDGTAYPAYTATCGGAFVLVGGQVCIDNTPNHQVFITVGGGPGLGGNGFQSGEGFIVDSQKPTACDVQNYLHGKSIQAGGGFIAGGEFVWGNEPASGLGNYGVTAGFVIPGISATISYGWQVGGPNAC